MAIYKIAIERAVVPEALRRSFYPKLTDKPRSYRVLLLVHRLCVWRLKIVKCH